MVENLRTTTNEVSEFDKKAGQFAKVISTAYLALKEANPELARQLGFIDSVRVAKTALLSKQHNGDALEALATRMGRPVEDVQADLFRVHTLFTWLNAEFGNKDHTK